MDAPLFPLFADLNGRAVLVVGGGAVAGRKVEALLHAGARPRVGAPHLSPALRELAEAGRIDWLPGLFDTRWLAEDVWLVVAATDTATVNQAVARAAEAQRLFVNVVDDAQLSRFHVPAVVERGALQIAISSGGAAPRGAPPPRGPGPPPGAGPGVGGVKQLRMEPVRPFPWQRAVPR